MSDKQTLKAFIEEIKGKMIAVASTQNKDRMGDVLDQSRWDLRQFKKNPVLLAGHNYAPEYVIGVAKNIKVEGEKLMFEPVFHELTQLARDLGAMVREGFLKAFSVGFIPNALMMPEDKSAKNELLEISLVSVPANAEALMVDAKGYDENTKKEIGDWVGKTAKDVEEVAEDKKKKPKEKSPKCRMSNETFDECLARKIPEIMDEDPNIDKDQATAIAANYCKVECEEADKQIIPPVVETKAVEIETKEGRVISKKNKEKIVSAVEATKQAVVALEELLEMAEPQEEKPKDAAETVKVEKTKSVVKKTFTQKEVVTQILKKIAGNSNLALKKLKEG